MADYVYPCECRQLFIVLMFNRNGGRDRRLVGCARRRTDENGTRADLPFNAANEQAGLTAIQTLFPREHNRIIAALPASISQEDRFQLARAVVIAEIQHITYNGGLGGPAERRRGGTLDGHGAGVRGHRRVEPHTP